MKGLTLYTLLGVALIFLFSILIGTTDFDANGNPIEKHWVQR